tara:strand:- start:137 stop:358 length:222 start_codon:yes stop_codon:yes gene_type:complete
MENKPDSSGEEFDSKVKEFKRALVREWLNRCTEDQKSLFNKMYGSIDTITEEKMRCAYSQCKLTVKKNTEIPV